MINLVPPSGHKAIKFEYYLRVGATIGFLFTGVFVFLSIALVPTYVLVGAQIKAFESEKMARAEAESAIIVADEEVTLTTEMLNQFKRVPDGKTPSAFIEEIVQIAPASVSFSNFIVSAKKGVIEDVKVSGKAPTREALAELKNALEASDMFEKAEVPIADLARDVDVPFAITVTLKKE